MATPKTFYIDGREIRFELNDPTIELRGALENTIGKAKRGPNRDYQPGTAMFIVMNRMLDHLWVDGKEIQWKKGRDQIPLLYDENGLDLFDRLLGEILREKNTQRLLLSKPEYKEVFEEYVLPDDDDHRVEDLDPTGSQTG